MGLVATTLPGEAPAIRAWAIAAGYSVGGRGHLPASIRTAWLAAGAPWLGGITQPSGWEPLTEHPSLKNANETRGGRTRSVKSAGGGLRRKASAGTVQLSPQAQAAVASRNGGQPPATAPASPQPPLNGVLAPPPSTLPAVLFLVDLVSSGGSAVVMNQAEVDWFNASRGRYLDETRFTENTDLQDLDRLLGMELLLYRWNQWMLAGVDYNGNPFDDMEIAKKIREQSGGINALKDSMGLSKKSRDAGAAGVADRWADLLKRAKAFGYLREEQVRVALMLFNDLSAKVGAFDRSDEEERRKLGVPDEHALLNWIRVEAIPRYRAVDDHFRTTVVSTWTRA